MTRTKYGRSPAGAECKERRAFPINGEGGI